MSTIIGNPIILPSKIDALLKITAIGNGTGVLTLDVSGTKFSGVLPTSLTFFVPWQYGAACGYWTQNNSAALGFGSSYSGFTIFSVSLDSQGNYTLMLTQGTGGVPAQFANEKEYTFYIE